MSNVDLHIHTSVSDGRFSPAEIVSKSAKAGMAVIAIADHDNVDGIAPAIEAARQFAGLKVIPCVEISTYVSEGEVHMLGYFVDYLNVELLTALKKMRDSRQLRAQGMIAKLADLGLNIEWERVKEIAGSGSVGRPHIARALLEKGYISTIKEAFTRYIAWGGPAYVEREKINPAEAVELILKSGGIPVLAHPPTVNKPEEMVIKLKDKGLAGLEAYYDNFSREEIHSLVTMANRYGLIVTGGSDYHGLDESIETLIGGADVPLEVVEQLISLHEKLIKKPVSL